MRKCILALCFILVVSGINSDQKDEKTEHVVGRNAAEIAGGRVLIYSGSQSNVSVLEERVNDEFLLAERLNILLPAPN